MFQIDAIVKYNLYFYMTNSKLKKFLKKYIFKMKIIENAIKCMEKGLEDIIY